MMSRGSGKSTWDLLVGTLPARNGQARPAGMTRGWSSVVTSWMCMTSWPSGVSMRSPADGGLKVTER